MSTWAVPSTTTESNGTDGRIAAIERASPPASRRAVEGPFRRQPPAHGSVRCVRLQGDRRRLPGVVRDRGARSPVVRRPDPIERVGPRLAGEHDRLPHEPPEEPQVRDDAEDDSLVQGGRQALERFRAIAPVGDDLREHRVEP